MLRRTFIAGILSTAFVAVSGCALAAGDADPRDFGALVDGVTDDTAAWNLALASIPNGGTLCVPPGQNLISSVLIPARVTALGSGAASIIKAKNATGNVITLNGQYAAIDGVSFVASVPRTSGAYILHNSSNTASRNFWMSGAFQGVLVNNGLAVIDIGPGEIRDTVSSSGVCIQINGGFDVAIRSIITDNAANAQPQAGISVPNCGDVTITDCNIIHSGKALQIEPGTGSVVSSLYAVASFFDTSTYGLYVRPTGTGNAVRCRFTSCWFSSATVNGIYIGASGSGSVNGFEFIGCDVHLNGGDGALIASVNVKNTVFDGGAFAQNSGSGISVAPAVSDFAILDARLGASHGLTGNAFGIYVNAGASKNYRIIGNDTRGNTLAGISDNGTGSPKVVANNI